MSRRICPRRPEPSREAGEGQAGGIHGLYSACSAASLSAPLPPIPQAKPFTHHPVFPTVGRGLPFSTWARLLVPSSPFAPSTANHHHPKSPPFAQTRPFRLLNPGGHPDPSPLLRLAQDNSLPSQHAMYGSKPPAGGGYPTVSVDDWSVETSDAAEAA